MQKRAMEEGGGYGRVESERNGRSKRSVGLVRLC